MIYGYDSQIVIATLILLVAMGSATWNALVKIHQQPLLLVTLMVLPQMIIALPIAVTHLPQHTYTLSIIFLSSLIQTAYIIFLAKAYSRANLSIVYPIALGLAPIISFSFVHLIYHKDLDLIEIIGVIIICAGAAGFSLFNRDFWKTTSLKTKLYTLIVSILIAGYGLTDSFGVKYENNIQSYISWLFLIKGLMLLIPMMLLKKIKLINLYQDWKNYSIAGLLAGIGYAVIIWSFYYALTPLVLSLRASSIVFTVILAKVIIKEPVSFYKILLSMIIVSGIIIILIY